MKYKKGKYINTLEYGMKGDSFFFKCDGICEGENPVAARLICDLLLELSEGHAVFFDAFRSDGTIMEPTAILESAKMLLSPSFTFFHLSEARMKLSAPEPLVEGTLYFFEKSVEWNDFLVSAPIGEKKKRALRKSGKLDAYFELNDHGSFYCFECGRVYERRLLQFFEDMADSGYEVRGTASGHRR